MDVNEVLENLVHFGQYDWIPLWVIVQDAEDLVGVEDEDRILETTLALARGLLLRGFRAGDGPLESAVRFHAWRNQNPDSIADFIRQQWARRDDFPDWGRFRCHPAKFGVVVLHLQIAKRIDQTGKL